MGRITTYTASEASNGTPTIADGDVFAVDGVNGVRKITTKELANAMIDKLPHNAEAVEVGYGKSGIYRGANLGSGATFVDASTSAQRTAIQNGTFDGLFIGDYWTVNSKVYRIAEFNYWKRSGDTDFDVNHIVLVPDASFGNGKMNSTNIITGAYVGSEMYSDASSVLNMARTQISTDFGNYLATHREYLPNAVSNGAQSAGAWFDSTVDLMNELMVYGHHIYCNKIDGINYLDTIDKVQLALFRLNPAMVNLRSGYWLRDVMSSAAFALVNYGGGASYSGASSSYGVRLAFPVKGTA